jgi:hypothetical protein
VTPTLVSALPAMEDAVYAALLAAQADPTNPIGNPKVAVSFGDPGPAMMHEHVWTSPHGATDQTWDLTGLGSQQEEESIELHVGIHVNAGGSDWHAVRDRGHAIAGAVQAIVRRDLTLAGSVWTAEVTRLERQGAWAQEGIVMEFDLTLSATSWLDSP